MPKVEMENIGSFECTDGERLVLGIMNAGVDILHRCGGNARCTTCRVDVLDGDAGPINEWEEARLARLAERSDSMRLSCQVQVNDDLKVRIIRRLQDNPEMGDAGPDPIAWPADKPLPPE